MFFKQEFYFVFKFCENEVNSTRIVLNQSSFLQYCIFLKKFFSLLYFVSNDNDGPGYQMLGFFTSFLAKFLAFVMIFQSRANPIYLNSFSKRLIS